MSDLKQLQTTIDDIIGKEPNWLIRSGNSAIAILVVILFGIAALIAYPDTVNGTIRVASMTPPIAVKTPVSGYVANLLVQNNQWVQRGTDLVVLDSTVSYSSLTRLEVQLSQLRSELNQHSALSQLQSFEHLGDLQPAINKLRSIMEEMVVAQEAQLLQSTIVMKEIEIEQLDANLLIQQSKEQLIVKDVELAKERFLRKSQLAQSGLVSSVELLGEEQRYAQSKLQLLNVKETQLELKNKVTQCRNEKHQIELEHRLKKDTLLVMYRSALAELNTLILTWRKAHVLSAPQDGAVILSYPIVEGQSFPSGTELLFIKQQVNHYEGHMYVSPSGAGKLELGQRVKIALDEYPENEFGYLTGHIASISAVPSAGQGYLVTVALPENIKTKYQQLELTKATLLGQAEIITRQLTWLERIFFQIRAGFDAVS